MIYIIIIRETVKKELKEIPDADLKKIKKIIISLGENPFPHGCLKLEGFDSKLYKIRKGDYRIIYSVEHQIVTVTILKIAHRKDVYRN